MTEFLFYQTLKTKGWRANGTIVSAMLKTSNQQTNDEILSVIRWFPSGGIHSERLGSCKVEGQRHEALELIETGDS